MATKVFINLAVKDLDRSKEFFTALGYTFNEKFTNDKGACLVVSDSIYVMLLTEDFFQTFTEKELVDAMNATEVMTALSCESREAVDAMFEKGIDAGGTEAREPQDEGFMYGRALEDLDGHIWEFFWMDEAAVQTGPPEEGE